MSEPRYRIRPAPELLIDGPRNSFCVAHGQLRVVIYGYFRDYDVAQALALREWLDGVLEAEPQTDQTGGEQS